MRTTLTLDEDVARLVADEAHRTRHPFKHVVNDALRRGLARKAAQKAPSRYRVVPHDSGRLLPGIDAGRMNQLLDELDVGEFVERHAVAERPARKKKVSRR